MRRRSAALLVFAGSLLALPRAFGVVVQEEAGPLAGQNAEQESYPDASRWPGGELEKTEGKVPPEELDARTLANPDSWLSALLQAGLPAGLTLAEGVATRVMSDAAEKWFVVYPFNYRNIRVAKYSDAFAVVSSEGEVFYIRKRNVPGSVDATEPTVPAGRASAVARKQAEEAFGSAQLEESSPELEVWVEPSLEGRLAWTLTIRSTSLTDPKARRYWVAAVGQPQVLQAENLIYHTHSGTVSATVWETSPLHPTSNRLLPEIRLTRSPGGVVQVTGLDGRYGYTDGAGIARITATLEGPRSLVYNQAGDEMKTAGTGLPKRPINLIFGASGEMETAQTSAYFWTNATYQLARSILDPLEAAPFANLNVNVNIDNTCDAFWSTASSSINFFKAGDGCPNAAYSDVVAHEYGHGVDHWRGGILDGGYSEGFGDVMALLLTRQSCYGRDFVGAGTCLRSAAEVNLWPPGIFAGVHDKGKPYAQFVWQLVQELKKTSSEEESFRLVERLVLAAAATNPADILEAVRLSFLADDTDGNLANGTPHCKELVAAAESRKLPVCSFLDCPRDQMGFAFADRPLERSYTPAVDSYNSSGKPILITRSSVGVYQVRFTGLGPCGRKNVQVTSLAPGGSAGPSCRLEAYGGAFETSIRCFDAAGAPADALFTVLVTIR